MLRIRAETSGVGRVFWVGTTKSTNGHERAEEAVGPGLKSCSEWPAILVHPGERRDGGVELDAGSAAARPFRVNSRFSWSQFRREGLAEGEAELGAQEAARGVDPAGGRGAAALGARLKAAQETEGAQKIVAGQSSVD